MEVVGQAVAGAPAAPPRHQRSPLAEQAAELLHKRCKVGTTDKFVLLPVRRRFFFVDSSSAAAASVGLEPANA